MFSEHKEVSGSICKQSFDNKKLLATLYECLGKKLSSKLNTDYAFY